MLREGTGRDKGGKISGPMSLRPCCPPSPHEPVVFYQQPWSSTPNVTALLTPVASLGPGASGSCTDQVTLLSLLTCGPGIVQEKLLNDYLHRIFSSRDHTPTTATNRYGRVGSPSSVHGTRPRRLACGLGGLGFR